MTRHLKGIYFDEDTLLFVSSQDNMSSFINNLVRGYMNQKSGDLDLQISIKSKECEISNRELDELTKLRDNITVNKLNVIKGSGFMVERDALEKWKGNHEVVQLFKEHGITWDFLYEHRGEINEMRKL